MRVSIVLIDWSVRESFHTVESLQRQTAARASYELIWVERHGHRAPEIAEHTRRGEVDRWVVLDHSHPRWTKHEVYNAGALAASGDVLVFADSDVLYSPTFVERVRAFFASHDRAFLHLDRVNNQNTALWPFGRRSWDEVMQTPGLQNYDDRHRCSRVLAPDFPVTPYPARIFERNYGACLCVRSQDFFDHGGFDEHEGFGVVNCGPYDLSWRLRNAGFDEHWLREEFLLHPYHPWWRPEHAWTPHVRMYASLSVKHLFDGVTMPIEESPSIRARRTARRVRAACDAAPSSELAVVAWGASGPQVSRLAASLEHATREPVSLHVAGSCAPADAVAAVARSTRARRLVCVPATALLRPGALDRLLTSDPARPLHALHAVESRSLGFLWTRPGLGSTGATLRAPAVAGPTDSFRERSRLTRAWERAAAEAAMLDDVNPVDVEILGDSGEIPEDPALETLIAGMADAEYRVLHGGGSPESVHDAEKLLDDALAIDAADPGRVVRYTALRHHGLLRLWNFVVVFRLRNDRQRARRALEMVARVSEGAIDWAPYQRGAGDLLPYDRMVIDDARYFAGSAGFHLASYALEDGARAEAARRLRACLDDIPDHRRARELLAELGPSALSSTQSV